MIPSTTALPPVCERVVTGRIGSVTFLFHLEDRRLHLLNESAGEMWNGLIAGESSSTIVSRLAATYGAGRSVIEDDLSILVERLRRDGLVAGSDCAEGATPGRAARLEPRPGCVSWPAARSIRALEASLTIETSDEELGEVLAEVLAPLATDQPATSAIRVDVRPDGSCEVRSQVGERAVVTDRAAAVTRVVGEVNSAAVESVPDRLVLHAGAVAGRLGAVVLPARSESGKSTLTAELVRAGMGYLTDEAAAVSGGGLCHPYPKAIGLDPGSFPVHPDLAPVRTLPSSPSSGLRSALDSSAWHVAPTRLGPVAPPTEVTAIVFPTWRADTGTLLARCPPDTALPRLVGDAFDFAPGGQPVFDVLCDLVDRLPAWSLTYSDLDDAVAVIRDLVD